MAQVGKRYAGALPGDVIEPLKSIDLTVDAGDFISIIGDYGVGKSTLLHVLEGMINPTSGELFYNEKPLKLFKARDTDAFRARAVSVIFQEFQLVQALTVKENLMTTAFSGNWRASWAELESEAENLFDRLGLAERCSWLPSRFSGGQKRRAMVIAAVLRDTEFILADVPTNDTDRATVDEIMAVLSEQAQQDKAVVIVSRSREVADRAEKKYALAEGSLRPV